MLYEKKYGFFREVNGIYYGYTENSFTMDWSKTHVRAWDFQNMEYYKKYFKDKKLPVIVVRITSSNPKGFHIDWKGRESKKDRSNFEYRNVRFKQKII